MAAVRGRALGNPDWRGLAREERLGAEAGSLGTRRDRQDTTVLAMRIEGLAVLVGRAAPLDEGEEQTGRGPLPARGIRAI